MRSIHHGCGDTVYKAHGRHPLAGRPLELGFPGADGRRGRVRRATSARRRPRPVRPGALETSERARLLGHRTGPAPGWCRLQERSSRGEPGPRATPPGRSDTTGGGARGGRPGRDKDAEKKRRRHRRRRRGPGSAGTGSSEAELRARLAATAAAAAAAVAEVEWGRGGGC